jgi:hypothetical protein
MEMMKWVMVVGFALPFIIGVIKLKQASSGNGFGY